MNEVKRARVVELIDKFDSELAKDPDRFKFKIAFDDDAQDDYGIQRDPRLCRTRMQ